MTDFYNFTNPDRKAIRIKSTDVFFIGGLPADAEIMRVDGDALCKCGKEYIDHPRISGYPTFYLACGHRIVKT